ncbi:hypothetical protein Tco_0833163 [Tanacetum coccineum]
MAPLPRRGASEGYLIDNIKDYRNEKIDIRFRRECESMIDELKGKFNGMSIEINKKKELQQLEQAAKLSTYTTESSRRFNSFYDYDDYEESTIPLNEINSQIPTSTTITPVLPTLEPEDSISMGDEHLSTIPKKESNEFIKSSVEDLVPIPSESEDTSESYSDSNLPSCDDFSPINVSEKKSVTFSNPLFDSNDDFTSSDDESLSDEDVREDNFKIYLNPLFEFDDEYIFSDVNPLFDEVLEDIENKDSYVSNRDELALLVTPLSDFNEDECFDLSGDVDEIELLLHHDPSTPKMSVVSILDGFTDEPPLKENDDLFDLESKTNDWNKILYDASIDDLIFDLGGDIDEINAFLDIDISTDIEDGYHDSEGEILYLENLLINDTILSLPPKVFLDHDPRSNGYPQKDEKQSKKNKTGHENEKSARNQSRRHTTLAILRNIIGGFDVEGNQGLKLIDQELVMIQGSGLKIEERIKGLESSSHHYK